MVNSLCRRPTPPSSPFSIFYSQDWPIWTPTQQICDCRQLAFADRLSLSAQEREALAASLTTYSEGLKNLRATVVSMTNGNARRVGLAKSQTDSLTSQRLAVVNSAATTLISSLSAISKSRLDSIS